MQLGAFCWGSLGVGCQLAMRLQGWQTGSWCCGVRVVMGVWYCVRGNASAHSISQMQMQVRDGRRRRLYQ